MKIDRAKVADYINWADGILSSMGKTRQDVKTGRDAWTLASRCGITRDAYDIGREITDGHIQTALEKVFPAAVFSDKKVY